MPDDDRKRRRLGDETKGRIADLASGWDAPPAPGAAPGPGRSPGSAPAAARPKAPTKPPPPPGAAARPPAPQDDLLAIDFGDDDDDDLALDDEDLDSAAPADGPDLDDALSGLGDEMDASSVRARRPSALIGPNESGTVDVSGVIPEKVESPQPVVQEPSVDTSGLSATTGPTGSAAAAGPARAGAPGAPAPGAPKSGPVAARGPTAAALPPPTRTGARTVPPPAPGARSATGAATTAPGAPSAAPPSGAATAAAGGAASRAAATGPVPSAAASGNIPRAAAAGPVASAAASGNIPRSAASGPVAATAASGGTARAPASGPVAAASSRPPPPADPAETTPRPALTRAGRAAPIPDDSGVEVAPAPDRGRRAPGRAVPLGEFDSSQGHVDPSSLRAALDQQPVHKHDVSSELNVDEIEDDADADEATAAAADASGAAPAARRPAPLIASTQGSRGDPTTLDPAIRPRDDRGDPTLGGDPTVARVPGSSPPKARLRTIAQLRRRRGVGGDLRYVLTAIFGLRRARRELAQLEAQQATLHQSRRRHLITLGRTAVAAENVDHPSLGRAREQIAVVEDDRVRYTGQVTASDTELGRVSRDREGRAQQHTTDVAGIDAELAELAKKLEPLEKEVAGVTRRAADLREAMRRADEKIAFAEAGLQTAEPEQRDALKAELASLKAARKDLQKGEPELAAALDSLHPRIAKLEAARADARKRRTELGEEDQTDQRRTEELLTAIGARRKVVDRGVSDAEARRDRLLFELGDRLYVDRPDRVAPELAPVDAIDVELGTVDRRTMELREILSSVDRWKIVRGVALWILLLAVLGAIAVVASGLWRPF